MFIEVLDQAQPWSIDLPSDEGLRGRGPLVGRDDCGSDARSWTWDVEGEIWVDEDGYDAFWSDIVHDCLSDDLTLISLPKEED